MNGYVGISEPDKQYNAELFFFPFLNICIIHIFFSFKRKHNCDNGQTKNKTNATKKIYRNVEDNSLPIVSD